MELSLQTYANSKVYVHLTRVSGIALLWVQMGAGEENHEIA